MPKLIDMVRSAAPTLASALAATGPLGIGASAILNGVLGLKPDATAKQQEAAFMNATPDQLLALKQADNDFAIKMRELDLKEYTTDAEDRASARQREVAMGADLWNKITMAVLASVALLLLAMVIYLVTSFEVPAASRDVLFMIVGGVLTLVTQVFNYYFGSSSGSRQKNDSLTAYLNKRG